MKIKKFGIEIDIPRESVDRYSRYIGFLFLLYPFLLAILPSWRIPSLRLFFIQHPYFPSDWFTSLIVGIALVGVRWRYIKDLYFVLTGRPPIYSLFETAAQPFRTFQDSGDTVITTENLLECDEATLSKLNGQNIQTKAQLIQQVDSEENLEKFAKKLDVKKRVVERIAYFNFIKSELFSQQAERTRRRIFSSIVLIAYSIAIIMLHGWMRINDLKKDIDNLMVPEETYKKAISMINFEYPIEKSQEELVERSIRVLRSIGARPNFASKSCGDLLLWFFTNFLSGKSKKTPSKLFETFLNVGCSKEALRTDLYTLKARVAFQLSQGGIKPEYLELSRAYFDSACLDDNKNFIAKNGRIACGFLKGLTAEDVATRWSIFDSCLNMLYRIEVDLKSEQPKYQTYIYSKIWNNRGYTMLQLFNDYWYAGDSTFFKSKGLKYIKRYPNLSGNPEVFLDSVRLLFDYACTHDRETPEYWLSMAELGLIEAKFYLLVKKMTPKTIYEDIIEKKVNPYMDEAKKLGWDGRVLWDKEYKERYHFDIIDSLGYKEWFMRYTQE